MLNQPVRLRPIQEAGLEMFGRFDTDPATTEPFEWSGFRNPHARRRRWEQDGWLSRDSGQLVVALPDGSLVGVVSWRTVSYGGPEGGCLELGVLLLPEHRGRGIGTTAQRLLVDYLFTTTPVHRLQAVTDVDNVVEQRALERVGFRREGVLRGIAIVGGRWHDGIMYGRLRDDPT